MCTEDALAFLGSEEHLTKGYLDSYYLSQHSVYTAALCTIKNTIKVSDPSLLQLFAIGTEGAQLEWEDSNGYYIELELRSETGFSILVMESTSTVLELDNIGEERAVKLFQTYIKNKEG